MENIIYKRREGAPFKEEDTEMIAKIIAGIEKKQGIVKPEDLVEEARDKNSPIHNLFEWNDKKGAYEYRLQQGRSIINHIEIEVRSVPSSPTQIDIVIHQQRAFHNVVSEGERGYVSTVNVVREEDLARQVLQRLTRQLEGATNELRAFEDYRWVVSLLENTILQIKEKVEV